MRKVSEALWFVAITLWVGGLWAIGYIAAPVLFSSLGDRQLAGVVAGAGRLTRPRQFVHLC